MNRRLALVVFAFAFMVVIYVGIIRRDQFDREAESQRPAPWLLSRPRARPQVMPGESSEARKPATRSSQARAAPLKEDEFQRRYGHFRVSRLASGRIVEFVAESAPGRAPASTSERGEGEFNPQHGPQVIERAWRVLDEIRDLVGLNPNAPLGVPEYSSTDLMAQVVFPQLVEGVPLANGGKISIVFGHQGEIRGIYSDYYPRIRVPNRRVIPVPSGGRAVAWRTENEAIPGQSELLATVRMGNETRDRGIQRVTDAETGEKLFERSRRIY